MFWVSSWHDSQRATSSAKQGVALEHCQKKSPFPTNYLNCSQFIHPKSEHLKYHNNDEAQMMVSKFISTLFATLPENPDFISDPMITEKLLINHTDGLSLGWCADSKLNLIRGQTRVSSEVTIKARCWMRYCWVHSLNQCKNIYILILVNQMIVNTRLILNFRLISLNIRLLSSIY